VLPKNRVPTHLGKILLHEDLAKLQARGGVARAVVDAPGLGGGNAVDGSRRERRPGPAARPGRPARGGPSLMQARPQPAADAFAFGFEVGDADKSPRFARAAYP